MPSGTFPDCCCQSRTHGEALLTHTSTGHPPTLAGSLVQPLWGYCSFPLSLGARKVLFVPPKTSFCLPLASHSCGNLVIKSRWPSRWDSLGIPSPFVRFPGWEAWRGFPNLPNSGGRGGASLSLLFSRLWVIHPAGTGFDFMMIVTLLISHCSFFFVFGCGISSSGGFQCSPVDGCSTASCDFGNLVGDAHTPSHSIFLNQKPVSSLSLISFF